MLARSTVLALFAAALAACSAVSPAPTERQRAEATWADLLALAAAPDAGPERFAPLVVALGGDPARRYQVAADPADADDARALAGVARDLRSLLARVSTDGRFGYRTEAFRTETESEGSWRVLVVRFDDTAGTQIEVGLLPIDGQLLLGDVD